MPTYRIEEGKPSRSSDWTWKLTVDGDEMARGFAPLETWAWSEAHRYGRQYATEGDCRVTVRPPRGFVP